MNRRTLLQRGAVRCAVTTSGVAIAAAAVFALPADLAAQDYYSDVRPVLVQNCMTCHSEDGPGWSMEDAERTYDRGRRIARAVESRRMPPWLAEGGHQEYLGDLSLGDETIALIRSWADAGFPKGDARPDPEIHMASGMGEHHGFTTHLTMDVLPDEGYMPNQEWTDDYRCFVLEWPQDEPGYVTGFRAAPGNRNVGHHLVAFSIDGDYLARYQELDDMYGDGAGYTCFGGTLPDDLDDPAEESAYEARYPDGVREMDAASEWLAHWAPGMDGHIFPEETGIYMEPGDGVVVQMHYYASAAPGEMDGGTQMEFMLAPDVRYPAFHWAQSRSDWLYGQDNGSMVIPAGEMRTYETQSTLEDRLGAFAATSRIPADRIQALQIHSANIHMHAFGHSGVVTMQHASGAAETLLSIPRWDLGWQRDFGFRAPKVVNREDFEDTTIRVQCTYLNDSGETVYGGYGSFDEMCFNFSYISVVRAEEAATTESAASASRQDPSSREDRR